MNGGLVDLAIFSGRTYPAFTEAICDHLQIQPGAVDILEFANENIFVQYKENIRQRDVFLVQPLVSPVSTSIVELLIMIDAARRASAGRITAVIPYYAYGRSDKKDQPRVPISGRLLANLIETAGADRVITMNLHAGQIQGFFNIPLDELNGLYPMSAYFASRDMTGYTVVATDVGGEKLSRDMASRLDLPLAIVEKRRLGNTDNVQALNVIGDVDGRNALLIDDEILTAGTMVEAVGILREKGAREIVLAGYHAILGGPAVQRLRDASVHEIVFTDTVPIPADKRLPNMKIIPTAPVFGDAIQRIHTGQSVGALFQ
ncbi:MAG: ribose-phosphate diphosphokinase [Chloroflexota bacterium]|nr:ribose-phosphate diphosphokinase [Chloroflexota bacterium]